MRLHNSASEPMGPLRGPKDYLPPPITTRDELCVATGKFYVPIMSSASINSCISGAELDILNTYLGGVQDYPARALVSVRRQALADYLGVTTAVL